MRRYSLTQNQIKRNSSLDVRLSAQANPESVLQKVQLMYRVKINLRAYATRWRRQRRESLAESLRGSLQRVNATGWKPVAPLTHCWPLQLPQPQPVQCQPQPSSRASLWAMLARGPVHG